MHLSPVPLAIVAREGSCGYLLTQGASSVGRDSALQEDGTRVSVELQLLREETESVATRKEAEAAITRVLLDHIRADNYPSNTQMTLLEESIPLEMVDEYLEILLEKIQNVQNPSIPMIRRVQRVAEALPPISVR
jgi:hypothetical protein